MSGRANSARQQVPSIIICDSDPGKLVLDLCSPTPSLAETLKGWGWVELNSIPALTKYSLPRPRKLNPGWWLPKGLCYLPNRLPWKGLTAQEHSFQNSVQSTFSYIILFSLNIAEGRETHVEFLTPFHRWQWQCTKSLRGCPKVLTPQIGIVGWDQPENLGEGRYGMLGFSCNPVFLLSHQSATCFSQGPYHSLIPSSFHSHPWGHILHKEISPTPVDFGTCIYKYTLHYCELQHQWFINPMLTSLTVLSAWPPVANAHIRISRPHLWPHLETHHLKPLHLSPQLLPLPCLTTTSYPATVSSIAEPLSSPCHDSWAPPAPPCPFPHLHWCNDTLMRTLVDPKPWQLSNYE